MNAYGLEDVTEEVANAAKILLDNKDLRLLVSTKLNTLGQDVLVASPGEELENAHKEYWALRSFFEWVENAAKQATR